MGLGSTAPSVPKVATAQQAAPPRAWMVHAPHKQASWVMAPVVHEMDGDKAGSTNVSMQASEPVHFRFMEQPIKTPWHGGDTTWRGGRWG